MFLHNSYSLLSRKWEKTTGRKLQFSSSSAVGFAADSFGNIPYVEKEFEFHKRI